jgi:hypothetical protein
VKLVGGVLLAGEGAFEVGDEGAGDLVVLGDALIDAGVKGVKGQFGGQAGGALRGGGSEMTARVTDATRARRATGLEPRRRSAGLAWIDRTQAFIMMMILKSFCGAEERGDEVSSMRGRRFD